MSAESDFERVVLVTGASKGIGAAIAAAFAAPGHLVLVHCAHDSAGAAATAAAVAGRGAAARVLPCADLSTELGCARLADAAARETRRLDVLVNNAGVAPAVDGARDFERAHWERVFATNVFSMAKLTALLVPLLARGRRPAVVNLGSVVARSAAFRSLAYTASKGAIDVLTRFQATELAPAGIRVNVLAPGHVATDIQKDETPEELERTIGLTPLGRSATVEEIAQGAVFLADNTFVTGLHLAINGGIWMQ